MTFPIKTLASTIIMQISGVSGLIFRKHRIEPIQTVGNFAQYELPTGLYEICQDQQYWYLFVDDGKGQYVTIMGAMQKAELLDHS